MFLNHYPQSSSDFKLRPLKKRWSTIFENPHPIVLENMQVKVASISDVSFHREKMHPDMIPKGNLVVWNCSNFEDTLLHNRTRKKSITFFVLLFTPQKMLFSPLCCGRTLKALHNFYMPSTSSGRYVVLKNGGTKKLRYAQCPKMTNFDAFGLIGAKMGESA